MRLKNFLNDTYIGLTDKNYETPIKKTREIDTILRELNRILEQYYKRKDLKFDIVSEYKSPTEILDIDESKLERITRRGMKYSEIFEDIKIEHIKALQKK